MKDGRENHDEHRSDAVGDAFDLQACLMAGVVSSDLRGRGAG
jgi:hypothetical protein